MNEALIAAVALLGGILFEHWFSRQRERERSEEDRRTRVWERRLDQILEIERLAGLLFDRLMAYRPLEEYDHHPRELYADLENKKGLVVRYDALWKALNEFNHRAALTISDWQRWSTKEERDQQRVELEIAFGRVLEAVDELK